MNNTTNHTEDHDQGPDEVDALDVLGELACTNTALRRAARRLGQLYDEALAPIGLKATQVAMIAQISRFAAQGEQAGPTLQDLAAQMAIQMSAISHALKPLLRDEIVELRQDPQDKRTKRCALTPKGRDLLAQALGLWAKANNRVEEVLGHASATLLRNLADTVASEQFLTDYSSGSHPTSSATS